MSSELFKDEDFSDLSFDGPAMTKSEKHTRLNVAFDLASCWFITGSRAICTPPVETTDIDYVLLVPDLGQAIEGLVENGWRHTSGAYSASGNNNDFETFRMAEYNLIVVDKPEKYQKWKDATALAKRFRLNNKSDRIALFAVVVDDACTDGRDLTG